MTCDEAEILLSALIDGELDAGHVREVEAHVAECPRCAAALAAYRQMNQAIAAADLSYTAATRAAPAHRSLAAASARRAEPALGAQGLCDGIRSVGIGCDRACRHRAAQ